MTTIPVTDSARDGAGSREIAQTTRSRVVVVVVNWNGASHLRECIDSLLAQTISAEIVVVDNRSTDGSSAILDGYGDAIVTIRNPDNRGFAAACNQGILAGSGELVALLNNDAVADPSWLEEMIRAADRHPRAGLVACKVLGWPDSSRFDTAGHVVYADGLTRGRGRLEPDRGQFDAEEEVFGPSGAAALLRRTMLDEVGLFDETFFAYCEDADLAFRARHAGWTCIYAPAAAARHRFSGSTGTYTAFKAFHVERNRFWLAIKNFPLPLLLVNPAFTLLRYVWQAWGASSGTGAAGSFAHHSGAGALLVALVRAWVAALAGAPRALAERRGIRRRSSREVLRWIRRFGISARGIALME